MPSPNKTCTFYLAALAALLALGGCQSIVPSSPATGATNETPKVLRLSRQHLDTLRRLGDRTHTIPLDETWIGFGVDHFEPGRHRLRIRADSPRWGLVREGFEIEAKSYNECRVTMRVSAGRVCKLNWQSDLEPSFERNPGVAAAIFADNAVHTYRIPLDTYDAGSWAGSVSGIQFQPSNAAAEVEILRLELRRRAPDAPRRYTIAGETHEGLAGSLTPWEIHVPPQATFEVHVGMLERSWKQHPTDGVRFMAMLEAPGSAPVPLFDEDLDPGSLPSDRAWRALQFDLGPYAGKTVCIDLRVEHRGTRHGDYAVWGNPMVYSRAEDPASTPVILISCDTLGAEHVSCYGYDRETTPFVDAFAEEGVLFENAIVNEPWTLPSHMSMLTGLYPANHGVTPIANLSETQVTLAEVLSESGFLCAGFTGGAPPLMPWRGFSHGFDVYDVPAQRSRNIGETRKRVDTWLGAHPSGAPFLFFHNSDIHSRGPNPNCDYAYFPSDLNFIHFAGDRHPEPAFRRRGIDCRYNRLLRAHNDGNIEITPEERSLLIALHDDAIRHVDHVLQDFLESLKSRGVYNRALIILTSDHGEAFGEHGKYGHRQVYDSLLRVPLIIKFPQGRFAGRRVSHMVQSVDLFPTVLDVLGFPAPANVDGQSLLALLQGQTKPIPHVFAKFTQWKAVLLKQGTPPHNWSHKEGPTVQAVRTNTSKLLHHVDGSPDELYCLTNDPNERANRYLEAPVELGELEARHVGFFQPEGGEWRIRFCGGRSGWSPQIELTTEGPLTKAARMNSRSGAQHLEGLDLDFSPAAQTVVRVGSQEHEEVVLKTEDLEGRLHLRIESPVRFQLITSQHSKAVRRTASLVLDPSNANHIKPPEVSGGPTKKPILHIWYVPPRVHSAPGRRISGEEVEDLRALGYL